MCELLGMSANVPTDICFSFSGLMKRGGMTGPHSDGWGISFYEGRGYRSFLDPLAGADSEIAKFVKSYPIKSKNVISHIRQANRGKVSLENTHPFSREMWGRHWSFAHNGQLDGMDDLPINFYQPIGDTDSEHAFCWLMGQIRQQFPECPEDKKGLWQFIQHCCDHLAEKGVYNMLLCDSDYLYTYCTTKLCWIIRKAPFGEAHLIDEDMAVNFKTVTGEKDVVAVIATQQLTQNETWHTMEKGDFKIFKDGNICFECNQKN